MPEREMSDQELLSRLKAEPGSLASASLHPADAAALLEQLDPASRQIAFLSLSNAAAAEVLDELSSEIQEELIAVLPLARASDIVEEMPADEAADLLGELPEGRAEAILDAMELEDAQDVRELLDYEADTAGGQMTTEFVAVPETLTVQETIERLRELSLDAETIYYLYVMGAEDRLTGVVSLRKLIVSDPSACLKDVMSTDVISVGAETDQEEAAELIARYNLVAVPVLNEQGQPIGIITVDDAVDVLDEEAAEDIYELGPQETRSGASSRFGPWSRVGSQLQRDSTRAAAAAVVLCYIGWARATSPSTGIPGASGGLWLTLGFLPAMLLLSWSFQSQARASLLTRGASDRPDPSWRRIGEEVAVGLVLILLCAVTCAAGARWIGHIGDVAPIGIGLFAGLAISLVGACVLPAAFSVEVDHSRRGLPLLAHALGVLAYLGVMLETSHA